MFLLGMLLGIALSFTIIGIILVSYCDDFEEDDFYKQQ